MNSKNERLNQIVDILHSNETVTTKMLSSMLNVSDMTIRRDIRKLEERGLVDTFYGGISLSGDPSAPQTMSQQQRNNYFTETTHEAEKKAIAQYASSLIEPRDAIAIDNGSTCSLMPLFMDRDLRNIIYTYSHMVMSQIIGLHNARWQLFMFGGYYHDDIKIFEFEDSINTIKKIRINKLFLGAAGVSTKYGISCVQPFEIPIRRALIDASDTVILLADSSKLGKSWFDHYAQLDDIDIIITDNGITPEQRKAYENLSVDLRII